MRKTRFITMAFLTALVAAAPVLGAAPATAVRGAGIHGPGLAWLPGVPMTAEEAEKVAGGDVRMRFMPDRNTMEVEVVSNEYEARLGRIPPVRYTIEAHNRLVETTGAPFLPTAASARMIEGIAGLTARPAPFPEGHWDITGVSLRSDRFGPYMISTNAWGDVEVYQSNGNGGRNYVGTLPDTGYAIHSNSKPFNLSASNGCIIIRDADAAWLAREIVADRVDARMRWDRDPPQSLRVERDM